MLIFTGASESDPKVVEWMADHRDELGTAAAHWFRQIRKCGPDVKELFHDGLLTACIGDYPFAYVRAYTDIKQRIAAGR